MEANSKRRQHAAKQGVWISSGLLLCHFWLVTFLETVHTWIIRKGLESYMQKVFGTDEQGCEFLVFLGAGRSWLGREQATMCRQPPQTTVEGGRPFALSDDGGSCKVGGANNELTIPRMAISEKTIRKLLSIVVSRRRA
jgi:hypothetical protein